MPAEPIVELVGRSSSHFTRVAAMFANELGVRHALVVVHDLLSLDPADYGGHPALKLPMLRTEGSVVFGTENICRRLVALAGGSARVVLPEHVEATVARNAQELTWHAMAAQVQLIVGTVFTRPPLDTPYLQKTRVGFEGALAWLEVHLDSVRAALPEPRDLSLLEVSLFCLITHLEFRPTLSLDAYPNLRGFAQKFGERPSARHTHYRSDPRPHPRPHTDKP